MKYIVDGNNLEELQIIVREPHGKDRIIEFKGDTDNLVPMSDVNLYDWDGTLLFAYTKENFLKMTDFPTVAAPEGMTFEGWNWSFENAKAYVEKYGKVNVGRMCYPIFPEEKKHALLMEMHIPEGGLTNVPLLFSQSVSHGVEIDWGDGSEIETVEGTGLVTTTHQYPSDNAVYTIAVKALDGCEIHYGDGANQKNIFGGTSDYTINYLFMAYLTSIIISDNALFIDDYAFNFAYNLRSIIVSNSVIRIGRNAFGECSSLESLIIPRSVKNINQNAFTGCHVLQPIVMPDSIIEIGDSAFNNCGMVKSLTIPEGVTSIEQYAFNGCGNLQILCLPYSITNIGLTAFGSCSSLASISIPDTLTSIEATAFKMCRSLESLFIPGNVSTIGAQAFIYMTTAKSLTISEGVTDILNSAFAQTRMITQITFPKSISTIGLQAFQAAVGLRSITISGNSVRIEAKAFAYCYNLEEIILLGTTPPTLGSADVFAGNEKIEKIYVPYSEDHSVLNAYKAATNWAAYADYMVESEPVEPIEPETVEEPINE